MRQSTTKRLSCASPQRVGHAIFHAERLLRRADSLFAEASNAECVEDRFRAAYMSALRGAGALEELYGAKPTRGRRSRNAWQLLAGIGAEWAEWATVLSQYSLRRAVLDVGGGVPLSSGEADDLLTKVGNFLDDTHRAVMRVRAESLPDSSVM
ncbi:hypothetical protein IEU95_13850 [Hoyosella rhizosphaerae]|uniref:SAV-6107-like HEPN domain-containing protein n=1 Tax=Hoyosella rhizosphaerae TaxID=1755582 RepID=A0A916XG75_9ACTN|nr:SAV_6107 family HEPN domain-containing protein [Hoyosella rhizosphaerae]MBN4927924.1 hypothetical protein [Hoyosella rhizosphaerae]GGC71031.1 hypothetical protein GCM10011410_24920 [Hoyosella rhizosphaerae]